MKSTKNIKIFIDANIFIAAVGSEQGGSALILKACCKGKFIPVTTALILKEAKKNIINKFNQEAVTSLYKLLSGLKLKICQIDPKMAQEQYGDLIDKKDAHVVVGAILSKSDFLLTLDKKHFFTEKIQKAKLACIIVTPKMFIENYL
ncbi:putative toxin-antitoxin system toxin component, PIN family [Patescibacteria group bacterium]|nr:putative toxin-antitoxin system toxin component, PIN family [Patescibacteria group bacterium]MBU1683985.1 putative toxin-antitoxin system toxin component, PIN family [Patescibacteria group bacterium]